MFLLTECFERDITTRKSTNVKQLAKHAINEFQNVSDTTKKTLVRRVNKAIDENKTLSIQKDEYGIELDENQKISVWSNGNFNYDAVIEKIDNIDYL